LTLMFFIKIGKEAYFFTPQPQNLRQLWMPTPDVLFDSTWVAGYTWLPKRHQFGQKKTTETGEIR